MFSVVYYPHTTHQLRALTIATDEEVFEKLYSGSFQVANSEMEAPIGGRGGGARWAGAGGATRSVRTNERA